MTALTKLLTRLRALRDTWRSINAAMDARHGDPSARRWRKP